MISLTIFMSFSSVNANNLWEEPQNTQEALLTPDLYAWKLFIALNWPADISNRKADSSREFGENDYTVWESWKLSSGNNDEVFLAKGKDPGPWLDGKEKPLLQVLDDFEKLPLQQIPRFKNKRIHMMFDPETSTKKSVNENHMNKEAYEFIQKNELYNIEGQEKIFNSAVELRDKARKKFDDTGVLPAPHEYKKKFIDFPPMSKEVKAQWREINEADKSRYRWQEFIDKNGNKKLYGLTALHITTKDLPNWLWATFEHIDNPKREGAEKWLIPTNDTSAGPNGYPENLGLEGTRWENYRLRGTIIDFFDSTGKPNILANSQVEEGFQYSSSCITCHARASIGPKIGNSANRLSIFDERFLIEGKFIDIGSVGELNNSLFEIKTFDDEVIGKLNYIQTDFVWSLMRAKRKSID